MFWRKTAEKTLMDSLLGHLARQATKPEAWSVWGEFSLPRGRLSGVVVQRTDNGAVTTFVLKFDGELLFMATSATSQESITTMKLTRAQRARVKEIAENVLINKMFWASEGNKA